MSVTGGLITSPASLICPFSLLNSIPPPDFDFKLLFPDNVSLLKSLHPSAHSILAKAVDEGECGFYRLKSTLLVILAYHKYHSPGLISSYFFPPGSLVVIHRKSIFPSLSGGSPSSVPSATATGTLDTEAAVEPSKPIACYGTPSPASTARIDPVLLDRLPEELYLVGTAHVSKASATLAYHTVRAVQPDAVLLELCWDRSKIALSDPRHIESEDGSGDAKAQETLPPSREVGGSETEAEASVSAVVTPTRVPPLSLGETLTRIAAGLKEGRGLLECVLTTAYSSIEAQLKTTLGLEFIRSRQVCAGV